MARRIVVVGGGLAGLAAAAVASRAGAEVTVHEARSAPGGRAQTDEVDGFALNQGAHALYATFEGMKVLTDLGITPRGKRPPLHGCGRLRGQVATMPGTPADLVRSRLVGPRTKLRLARLLASPRRLLRTEMQNLSMQQWIDARTGDADSRLLLAVAARTSTYCADLDTIDAAVAVAQMVGALTGGVLYLDGGWRQLVDALQSVAVRHGAEVDTDARIESLTDLGDCDAVILANGGPRHVATVLGDRSGVAAEWAADARPVYASSLDLGLRSLRVPERRFCLAVDDPLYLSVHTPSAALAPNGGEVVHLLRYGDSPGDARAEMEGLLDDTQPGWREDVVAERFGKRRVVAHDRPAPGGGGLEHRAGPSIPDCDHVYVAGDWVGRHGLLADAALASGRDAALAALAP